jgi:predicted transcriptional regulator
MKKKNNEKIDSLEEIKRLLILGLVNQGVKGKDIASVLGVDPAVVSRILAGKKL